MAEYHAYVGGKEISDFYIGGKQISEIWGGNTLLWTRSGEATLTGEYMLQFNFLYGFNLSQKEWEKETHTYVFFAKNGHKKVNANIVKAAAAYWRTYDPEDSANTFRIQLVPAFIVDGDILYDSKPLEWPAAMYYYYNVKQEAYLTGETIQIIEGYSYFKKNSAGIYTKTGHDLKYNGKEGTYAYKRQICDASITAYYSRAYGYSSYSGGMVTVAPYTMRDDFKVFSTLEKLNTYLGS